jgi:hypothetical protein
MSLLLFTYNPAATGRSPQEIHEFVTSLPSIHQWWHYLPAVYIFETADSPNVLARKIDEKLTHGFLVIRVQSGGSDGRLQNEAWDWLNSRINI